MRIFGTLVIWGWSKPYLELSDFPENWYGKSLQHILDAKKVLAAATAKIDFCCYGGVGGGCGGLTTAKTFFASRICCKDSPFQFSAKSDNSKYGLLQPQITSVPNILIFDAPLCSSINMVNMLDLQWQSFQSITDYTFLKRVKIFKYCSLIELYRN